MSRPSPPDFSRGWEGSKWFDPDMTAEERAAVDDILSDHGVYFPLGPNEPDEPSKTESTTAGMKPEPKPQSKPKGNGRRRKKRDDDGPMLF